MIGLIVQNLKITHSRGELGSTQLDEAIGETMSVLDHMAKTIEVFRDFYRPEREKVNFFLKDSVEKALSLIRTAIKHQNVSVECCLDEKLSALGYPNEFAQVLIIILTNARDVFKEKKTERPRITIKAFAEGKKGVVTITDNAGGVPVKNIGRVFDLYFTTKHASGGTGIGLYMARKIMERHMNGDISVANVDNGAQFRIELGIPGKRLQRSNMPS
jgi:C4-dicarboxylate-specific signal transduction histidine kinase